MSSTLVALALLSGDGLAHVATQREQSPRPYTASYPVEGERFHNLVIETYPIGFAIGRYAIGIEYMVTTHHAITLSPHVQYTLLGRSDLLDGVGGEFGYRYFFRTTAGSDGFFVGAAFTVGHYRYRDYADVSCGAPTCPYVFNADQLRFGGALEGGYQALMGPLLLGVGAGVELRVATKEFAFEPASVEVLNLVIGPGIRPRVFITVGVAF